MRTRAKVILFAATTAAPATALVPGASAQIYYTPVVTQVGDPANSSAAGNGNGATTSIEVFNYNIANQTIPLASSTWASGTLVNTADSTTEGTLTNNPALADAATAGNPYSGTAYVFSSGYAAAIGTTNVNTSAANRVVGFMSVTNNSVSSGTIGASDTAASTYSGGNIRGAVGDDTASNFWTAGTGSTTGATNTAAFRYANTSTQLTTSAQNCRQIQIRQGQLYGGSDTGSFVGVSLVGNNPNPSSTAGLPTTTLPSPGVYNVFETWATNGSPATSGGASPYAFVLMNDPNNPNTPTVQEVVGGNPVNVSVPFNVAYVDNVPNGGSLGGIQKWVYNPNTSTNNGWSLAYTIADPNVSNGYIGLAAQLVPNANSTLDTVELWATTNATGGNELEQFVDPLEDTTDTAANSSLTVLAQAPAYAAFRGVALAPIVASNLTWDNAGAPAGNQADGTTWDNNKNVNWNNGSAPTFFNAGDSVSFTDNNDDHYAVTLNSAVAPGSITVNSTGNYSISGTGTIGGTGGLTKMGTGTLTLSTPNTFSGGVNVSSGTLVVEPTGSTSSALPKGSLTISGGEVVLADGVSSGSQSSNPPVTAPQSNVNLSSLSIGGNGTLDIGNNHLIVDYAPGNDPIVSIAALIKGGYDNGGATAWTGTGITSSAAQMNAAKYGIGYADAADAGNPAGLASGQIEIAYTLLGDANLDGKVNGTDFAILASNFNKAATSWDEGDFNYDGAVNGTDFADLATNFNQGASQADIAALEAFAAAHGLALPTSVPEPASLGLLSLVAAAALVRRQRRI